MEKKPVFISTAIPYVNANPHIGFALELIEADALARFYRAEGREVFFLSGADENSLKNVQAAEKAGVETAEFVEKKAKIFFDLAEELNISLDKFIRTSVDKDHLAGARKLWQACEEKGDVYKKEYSGWYCVGCEEFKRERDLVGGRCDEHPDRELEEVKEENYFFRLNNYEDKLKDLIEGEELKIVPEFRGKEILNFIKEGLEDFSISRSRERAGNWGIPVPGDESQIMYVWFDALSNYINALGYVHPGEDFKKYWDNEAVERIHVIGKGINRFHTIYWPAMLLSAGVRIPSRVLVHSYITAEGQKMSKSLGNVIDPFELVEKYGAERVRYYLLREISPLKDGDFSESGFVTRCNGDLAKGLGNFTARVLALAEKYEAWGAESQGWERQVEIAREKVEEAIELFRLNEALQAVWDLIHQGDKFINDNKPWETGDKKIISSALDLLREITILVEAFLPESALKIKEAIKNKTGLGEPLFATIR